VLKYSTIKGENTIYKIYYRILGVNVTINSTSKEFLKYWDYSYFYFRKKHNRNDCLEFSINYTRNKQILLKDPDKKYHYFAHLGDLNSHFTMIFWSHLLTKTNLYYDVLHAACVTKNGSTLLFPASTSRGKTLLSLALSKRYNYRFISDDRTVMITDKLRALPFPRNLGIRKKLLSLLPELNFIKGNKDLIYAQTSQTYHINPRRILNVRIGSQSEVTHIIFLNKFLGQDKSPRLSSIKSSKALMQIIKFSLGPKINFIKSLKYLTELTQKARVFELSPGNLDGTLEIIDNLR